MKLAIFLATLASVPAHAATCSDGPSYTVVEQEVYYLPTGADFEEDRRLVEGADAVSFSVLHLAPPTAKADTDEEIACGDGERFGKDKSHVYFEGRVLKGALSEKFALENDSCGHDGTRVYCFGEELAGASPGKVKFAEGKTIQVGEKWFCGASAMESASFQHLGRGFARDKSSICKDGKILSVKDAKSFRAIADSAYQMDDKAVYYEGVECAGLAPAKTKRLQFHAVKDDKHVFIEGKKIVGVDAATFTHVAFDYWKDKSGFWSSAGEKILKNADAKSLRVLGRNYVADANSVYYRGQKIPGAHPQTFSVGSDNAGADRDWEYEGGERRGPRAKSEALFKNEDTPKNRAPSKAK